MPQRLCPQILYDDEQNLYVVALPLERSIYYYPLYPGVPVPDPIEVPYADAAADTPMPEVPALGIPGPSTYDQEDDARSTTTELTPEYVDYPFDYGRRYNAFQEGEYWAPNDDLQQDQMNISHRMFNKILGKLVDAPISKHPKEVIDLGTGTGAWAIDFAEKHPLANVTGLDFSAIQPADAPSNCEFIVDDICEEWFYPRNHFDLVHIRQMYGSVADWPALYQAIHTHLKPGGWVDQQEMSVEFKSDDVTLPDDHPFRRWSSAMLEAGEKSGKTFKIVDQARDHLINAGFVNVRERRYKVPIGTWLTEPGMAELGQLNLEQMKAGMDGWTIMPFMRELRWSYDDMRGLIRDVMEALEDPNLHAYIEVTSVCGRKPRPNRTRWLA